MYVDVHGHVRNLQAGVKGLDWSGPHQVVCFGSDDAGSANPVFSNSVIRIDLRFVFVAVGHE
jgi:hypothetical protein